jgi:4-amino-4-deoxy-L-arabinose transferase-like glycosyltransferase
MSFLGGGQDWLTYETLARDIQLGGPLMTLGKPLGQGSVLYNQPLYPYYLAFLHALAGEDYFGVTALQVLGLGVGAVLVYELARHLFGRPTAVVALALMVGVLVPFELAWVANRFLTEALYFWTMPAAVLGLLLLLERPTLARAAVAGLLLGVACLSRGPTLLYLPPAALLLWRGLRKQALSRAAVGRALVVVGLCSALLIGLVPLRNEIVAGKPNLTAASGGINLEKFHRPSKLVRMSAIDDDPLQRMLNADRPTREVIEFVRQDPAGYFASYLPLTAYALGVGSALNDLVDEVPVQLHPDVLILDVLYVLSLLLVARSRSLRSGLLHAFIGVHFATMVAFAPYDYENRLVMPMYLFVTVFAAAAIVGGWQLAVGCSGRFRTGLLRSPTRTTDYGGPALAPSRAVRPSEDAS